MAKNILFDLDGTLTDSGEGILNCAELALRHFGIEPPSREKLRVMVGPPLSESFLWFGVPKDRVEEAIRVYRSRYTTVGKFENFPYPGIPELLQALNDQGHRLYVATSKPEHMAVEILEHFNLARYFQIIAGAATDSTRSTKEAVIAYLLEQVGSIENAVMVGDTAYDVIGAKAHGIPTICVSWGYGDIEEMNRAGAIAIAESTDQLLDLLNK